MSDAQHKSAPKSVDDQLAYIRKGAAEIIPEAELRAKLEQSVKSGKPLRVYLGVDPTAPDIHLGHTVVLRKLKHFQDMGHTAIFLIGDFSAMIGDPTGQSETRPPLSREQVEANAQTYLAQVYKILDRDKTEVRYNSEWLGKMSSYDVVRLCGHYRLARMLEREDFRSRLEQKFNILVHREIQREYGLSPQVVFTMPILVGLDGAKKMSKSLGNYVGIAEPPKDMFGKLMSISDDLMWSYYELLTDFEERVIVRLKEEVRTGLLHPMDAKMQLAHTIIATFHGEAAARAARDEFQRVFRDRRAPEDAPVRKLPRGESKRLSVLLVELNLVPSRSEAERLIKQGGVEIDSQRVDDVKHDVDLSKPGSNFLLRAGKKKFLRITVE